ncbi:MAG: HAD family phosphatase [Flavobacteriaceae bacterium]|jgi:2-haloacid dehalogenase|nr:HAD family phosphatase [Flavobacteriaceae bacterium]MDG0967244.1 HAD family phosphatase [Flavobacteriaceae bacterium]
MIKNIVFDLGGVLIDWNPEYVFLKEFRGDREKMNWFFNTICTSSWNEEQDAGYSIEKATNERVAMFPKHERLIRMYYGEWEQMLGFEHTETVEILRRLHDSKEHSIYSLTNWSNETFPVALKKFPFLSWFKGILVSGDVGLKKPDPEIYKLLLDRYGLEANTCVFIDDRTENVKAASALGFSGIVFKNHTQLSKDLKKLNII